MLSPGVLPRRQLPRWRQTTPNSNFRVDADPLKIAIGRIALQLEYIVGMAFLLLFRPLKDLNLVHASRKEFMFRTTLRVIPVFVQNEPLATAVLCFREDEQCET